ncbi:MAG: chromosome segregation protein SMC [Planctomycetia bacterium]|nr:chromosome segregation protein SMC [Planctomycetia bacterium]
MLKALELVGFKSFADKTRFEFGAGITVVVGPNGSGKSNVVDAVKWVLGETSVKSLRGEEMIDVIFNGSATRNPLNTAEVTLVLDNAGKVLPLETPQVSLTRRVYRSGEGEYLINDQPVRRRDIRDLLAGTGLGTDSYAIIEQGKVDSLLSSLPKERRLVIEDAAGISRFRIKKLESQRRLERVEQNLLRLKDIVDEVEGRLRTVRAQAGKARRYRELSGRLKELRLWTARADWEQTGGQLAAVEEQLAVWQARLIDVDLQCRAAEEELARHESDLAQSDAALHETESRLAHALAEIASRGSAIDHGRARLAELEAEVERLRRGLLTTHRRSDELDEQARDTVQAAEQAQGDCRRFAEQLKSHAAAQAAVAARLDAIRATAEERRKEQMVKMREAAALGNGISARRTQVDEASAARQRGEERVAELDQLNQALLAQREDLHSQQAEAIAQLARRRETLVAIDERLKALRRDASERRQAWQEAKNQHTAASQRAALLMELEQRQEGLETSAKKVLEMARASPAGPLRHVRGVVADLFQVNVATARLIELALGDAVGHLVVSPQAEFLSWVKAQSAKLPGRVGFVIYDPDDVSAPAADLDRRPGVLGRADRYVETTPEFAGLARQLLQNVWVVDTLAAAMQLSRQCAGEFPGAPLAFITLAGELVDRRGVLSVGPLHAADRAAAGMIFRRSELRALRSQIVELDGRAVREEEACQRLERELSLAEGDRERLTAQQAQVSQRLAELKQLDQGTAQRLEHLDRQRSTFVAEVDAAAARLTHAMASLEADRRQLAACESALVDLEGDLARLARDAAELDRERQAAAEAALATRVELAKSEERRDGLLSRLKQAASDQAERERALAEHNVQCAQAVQRIAQTSLAVLEAESAAAELYVRKEQLASEVSAQVAGRNDVRRRRSVCQEQAAQLRAASQRLSAQIHSYEMQANQVRSQRAALADRLREDYAVEIADLAAGGRNRAPDSPPPSRAEAETEIADLRRKLAALGNVNQEAIAELDELEERFRSLSEQYADLAKARALLEQIIQRINVDSRRIFDETLETVRGHFQTLFRKLFGGGQADVVLEEGDPLEAGLEILARPPGKELRSISLLSGGEKTLTCVALLMAIFRSRPSPFCVLDEVDAALDEANIDRFLQLIGEFREFTQFIVVTHSKKTMTCATTLYGVTMQESGISKRVSVRFEDVSDDGQITLRDRGGPEGKEDESEAA